MKNLTTGSVFRTLIGFSLPYLLSTFLQTLYGMADLFLIGRFCGVESTTAVSIGSQVMHMLTVMIVGLAMGSTVMIGTCVGAGNKRDMARGVGNTATLFGTISIVLTAVLLLLTRTIVSAMSTPAEAVEGTVAYLTICFIGIPFITAYNIISSIFRGMGDSKSPMIFVAIACVINILLDLLLIGGCGMGPAGAALGTTVSQSISVVIALAVIIRRRMIPEIDRSCFRLHRKTVGTLLKVGIPVAMQDGFIQISFIAITVFANMRGLNDAAAVGVVEKLIGIMFLIPSSLLSSVSALAAQNIGAGRMDRAKQTLRYAIMIAVGFGLMWSVLSQFIAKELVGLFTADAVVAAMGGEYLRSYVWDCVFAGIHFCFSGFFCACGVSGLSFLHNSISILLARLPIAYYASTHYPDTLFPMGFAAPIGSIVSCLVCVPAFIWLMKREKKQAGST